MHCSSEGDPRLGRQAGSGSGNDLIFNVITCPPMAGEERSNEVIPNKRKPLSSLCHPDRKEGSNVNKEHKISCHGQASSLHCAPFEITLSIIFNKKMCKVAKIPLFAYAVAG